MTPLSERRRLAAIEMEARQLRKKLRQGSPRKIQHKPVEPAKDGKQRQPRERDGAYLAFIRRLPCVACTMRGEQPRPSQAAHVRAGYPEPGWRATGMQEKPSDWRCAPLCQHDHLDGPQAQHRHGERDWWAGLGIYPPALCADLKAAFPDAERGAVVIKQHCIRAMSAKRRELA